MTQNCSAINHIFTAQYINVYVPNKLLKKTRTMTEWQICWLKKYMQQGQCAEGLPCWIASLLCIQQLQYKYIHCIFGIKANRHKAVPVHTIKAYIGRDTFIAQFILNLGTTQKWQLNFPQLMLHPQGKKCCSHWIVGCVGSQPVYTFCENRKMLVSATTWTWDHPAHSLITIPITLSWLHVN
jgi:hypothetical protein